MWRGLHEWVGAVGVVVGITMSGCSRSAQAEACATDQQALAAVIQHDQRVGLILHEVDALAAAGHGVEAANRLDRFARPEASLVRDEASRLRARTRWGKEQQARLLELADLRISSISDYADALRSDDLGQVVQAMTAQRDVEQQALALQRAVALVPEPSTGRCEAP